ncbi:MAG: tRNA (N6-threonylcarbamoyladenosine(37)-N6)-methyltransferase TrmO [Desulfurivibrionaceae bacterium]
MEKPGDIRIMPVGVVRCGLRAPADAPKNYTESGETGRLEIFPHYLEAMDGIVIGSTLVVLCWLHQARRDLLKVYPRGDRSRGPRGVFATRSPARPNPIAISELTVLGVQGNHIEVSGLDVIDGTPILDVKPVIAPDKEK